MIDGWYTYCEITLRRMSLDLTEYKSTLVQVMAWCRQAPSHYLSQCWPSFLSPYGELSCSRLSNWFSLLCLRPWMKHLPPVWQLTLSLCFKWQLICKSAIMEITFILISWLCVRFYYLPRFRLLFSLQIFLTLKYHFYTKYFVLSYSIDAISAFFLMGTKVVYIWIILSIRACNTSWGAIKMLWI